MKRTVELTINAVYTFDDDTFSKKDINAIKRHIHRWVLDTMRNEACYIPFTVKSTSLHENVEYATNKGKFTVSSKMK